MSYEFQHHPLIRRSRSGRDALSNSSNADRSEQTGPQCIRAYSLGVTKRVAACHGKWSERVDAMGVRPGCYVGKIIWGKSEFPLLSGLWRGEGGKRWPRNPA